MATAYIREYAAVGLFGALQAPMEEGIADPTPITTSAASAQSAAFNANTLFIAISTPAAQAVCCKFGANPTATTSHLRLPANSVMFFGVKPGQKVALIDVT